METRTRSDPFREALSLRRAMDQLFEHSFIQPSLMPSAAAQMVPMDVCETPNGYEVDVALPGVRAEDIELTVDLNTLTIRGRYSHQEEHQAQGEQQDGGQGRKQRHQQGHNWLLREILSGPASPYVLMHLETFRYNFSIFVNIIPINTTNK